MTPITTSTITTRRVMAEQPEIVWDPIKKRYAAYLFMYGDNQFLGYFQTPEDAARGRTAAAHFYVQDFLDHSEDNLRSTERYPRDV